jgi:steroid delta-isomerase-like uncharacterized protein
MTREEVADLIGQWQRAAGERDVQAYAELYAEHASIESPMAGAVSGPDGAAKAFLAFFSAFPDAAFTWDPPIAEGTRVSAAAVLTGTDVGGFMGLKPSGKAFRIAIVFLLDLERGHIVRDRRIYDFTGLLVQIGVLKAKPV